MKNLILIAVYWLGLYISTHAQHEALVKEKMSVFNAWIGNWKGEGSMQRGPGPASKSSVDEKIEYKLGSNLLVVEGLGKTKDETGNEKTIHHAYGVLSFDPFTNAYKFRSYLIDGKSTDAWFTVTGENQYQWGFDSPQGKIRYSITLASNTWNEVGEFSKDGTAWMKFFEMNLTKQ
ncbi:MAG: DUF1579 domain-containing protein [Flammeovirgaceae bacterium]|nr:DUF1579 domain-containing protein [Flammeovirgaceae bacterium]